MMQHAFAATHSAEAGTRSLTASRIAYGATDADDGVLTCAPSAIHLHRLIRSLEARMSGRDW